MASSPVEALKAPGRSPVKLWIAAAALVLIAILAVVFVVVRRGSSIKSLGPFQIAKVTRLTSTGKVRSAVISPDGKYAVHVVDDAGQRSLWVRQVATSSNVQIVPAADVDYVGLTFSPDANFVYYVRSEKNNPIRTLFQVPVLGGTPKKIIEDVDSRITFSPSGDRFAFVRHSQAQGERESNLMIANANGSDEKRLAVLKMPELYLATPAWSPDGQVIACAAQKLAGGFHVSVDEVRVSDGSQKTIGTQKWRLVNGIEWMADGASLMISALENNPSSNQFQIWQLSYPGGELRRITNDLNNYAGISLTADSSTLATVQADNRTNIWVAPRGDATAARQITSGSVQYDQLTWAPDGRIVYVSTASGAADIWIMDADGKNQKQLTADSGVNVFPFVSPDGRYIVFNSNRGGEFGTFHVWRMDIDGGNPKKLTDGGGEYFPGFSSDGKWVIYSPLASSDRPTLWRVPTEGGDASRFTDYISLRPVASPDGKFIACQYSDGQPGTPTKIAIIPAEGGKPITTFVIPTVVRWTPDSKAVTYVEQRGGVFNIWSQPIAGGQPKQLTDFKAERIFSFAWSSDGTLVCTRGDVTTDVVLMSSK
jgi:Tol biopolymer transport system component